MNHVDLFLHQRGHHTCTSWPCSQPGMHRVPNGMWPSVDRLNRPQLTRAAMERQGIKPALTRADIREKAVAANNAKRAARMAEIIAKYDATRSEESIAGLALEYKMKHESVRRLLRRKGVSVPSRRGNNQFMRRVP